MVRDQFRYQRGDDFESHKTINPGSFMRYR